MKILYWLVAAPLMILAILFAVSNQGVVELGLWPVLEGQPLPTFLVVFGAFAIGFFAGGFVAWIGGHRHRVRARVAERRSVEQAREIADLRRKLDSATGASTTGDGSTSGQRALVAVNGR